MKITKTLGFLDGLDNTVRRLGPLSAAVEYIADKVAPKGAAQAATCPPSGYTVCYRYCEGNADFCQGAHYNCAYTLDYAPSPNMCAYSYYRESCAYSCGCGCP
jgi:hypothetical protein